VEWIDIEKWDRKDLFKVYFGTDFPYIILGADIDVTNLYRYARQSDISFYFAMVFAANQIANRIKNFRYRFIDGKPFLIEANRAVLTHIQPGSDAFVLIETEQANNMIEFCRRTEEKARESVADRGFGALPGKNDTIIYSVLPWVNFSVLIRTVAKNGIDCAPKISWGKYVESGSRLKMPLSLQVHHGLMDGYHVGLYFNQLQEYLDNQSWL
jgi:chloramphenicol O-acetyltransferase type A